MTFTEAAVEILRLVGRPLHYKKITELAIERNLLSHIGKAPELTMSSRLATMVKKDRGDEPIVKVKPGIFALREFTPEMMALADSDDDIDLSALPPPDAVPPPPSAGESEAEGEASAETPAQAAPRRGPHPGSEVFPEEEDDDQPILGNLEEDEEEGDDKDDKDEGRRGRRRRRRGRRGEEGDAPEARTERGGERSDRVAERSERGAERGGDRDRDRDRGRNGGRDRDRDRDRGDRDRDRGRRERDRGRPAPVDMSREPEDGDLLGRDLADSAISVLAASRDAVPLSYAELANELVRRGRLVGDPAALAPTVAAAVRADSRRRERSRLRHVEGRVALAEWYLPRDVVQHERELLRVGERLCERTRRAFLRKVQELPAAGFVELLATWLNAEGIGSLRGVRRPTSSSGEVHLAGVARRGPEELRVAVVLVRDGREITREKVVEVRGSLPHYAHPQHGGAMLAWIVSTGPVARGAREEAAISGGAPVALYDGAALAEAMEAAGVGIRRATVVVPTIDLDLLDQLRGAPEQPARDRVDAERERSGEPHGERPKAEGERPEAGEAAPADPQKAEGDRGEAKADGEGDERGGRRRRRRRRRGGDRDGAGGAAATEGSIESDEEEAGDVEGAVAAASEAAEASAADLAGDDEAGEDGVAVEVEAIERDDERDDERDEDAAASAEVPEDDEPDADTSEVDEETSDPDQDDSDDDDDDDDDDDESDDDEDESDDDDDDSDDDDDESDDDDEDDERA